MGFTHDSSIESLKEYKVIEQIIRSMKTSGVLDRLQHNCVGASEMLASLLLHEGIESKLVECYASIKDNRQTPPAYTFIGYDGLLEKEQIDIHMVVVTKTKTPLLIDLSIPYALSQNTPYVIGKLIEQEDSRVLAEFTFDNIDIRYNLKKNIKLPALHQKSILQRIKDEESIKEKLKMLQIFVAVIAGFALINFTLNMIAVILKIKYL